MKNALKALRIEAELGMQCFGGGFSQATLGKRLEAPQIA
jgi:hypothetical protein